MAHSRWVLIVDDDRHISALVTAILRDEGYGVRVASDGQEALELLTDEQPALILLDLHMPRMSGQEFIRVYRQRQGPHVPIVIFSAGQNAEIAARQLQADGYLTKPFDLRDLLRLLPDGEESPAAE
ncbi:MAG: response regulator [Chloroflexi bacterium]|nr:response regulator [Chloroflexota bacterium]